MAYWKCRNWKWRTELYENDAPEIEHCISTGNTRSPPESVHLPSTVHLQHTASDAMHDLVRVTNGLKIRRPRKEINILNESRIKSCVAHFDAGSYTRLQFLRAVRHSVGAHTDAPQPCEEPTSTDDDEDNDQQATTTAAATSSSASSSNASASDVLLSNCCEACLPASTA